jgi:flagellar basal-body rod protein FlgB
VQNNAARPALRHCPPLCRRALAPKICLPSGFCRLIFLSAAIPKVLAHWPAACNPRSVLDRVAGQLERYMDLLSARQKLVATNIANVDTPGYHTRDLDFQGEFQNAAGLTPEVVQVMGLPVKNDGNNVNLDRESRLLAENALRFQVASSLMHAQIHTLETAINGGGQS